MLAFDTHMPKQNPPYCYLVRRCTNTTIIDTASDENYAGEPNLRHPLFLFTDNKRLILVSGSA